MPPADPRTRDERYDDTRECNAPRAGRKAVCIFHAGAAPAVIENIYMLFMGHTCFRNQTRYRATPDSPCVLSLLVHLSHANPFFSASFPSTASLFLFRRSLRNGVFRCRSLSQLLHPLPRSNPPDLPATSREFYKTFHASLTASASFPPSKQRILVWIEFLMEPTPPGPRPTLFNHPAFRRRFPSPAMFGDSRASSASCMKTSRRLPPISIPLGARYHLERSRRTTARRVRA